MWWNKIPQQWIQWFGKSVKKKQVIRRRKDGNERHSAKKSHVKYNIIVFVKSKVYKNDVEPPDVGDREELEQVVVIHRDGLGSQTGRGKNIKAALLPFSFPFLLCK